MRILYLSCHSILEYEEVLLLAELGHDVFSPGAYVEPDNPGDASLRPSIPGLVYDPDILEAFHKIGQKFPGKDSKDHLSQELMKYFDAVVVMHLPRWVKNNWQVIRHKRVIWRTIGQSVAGIEAQLASYRIQGGLEVIRYSPMERNIPGFIGEDALIRFYKDPNQYGNWNGEKRQVVTFAQSMQDRGRACNFNFFEEVTRQFDRRLFGPGNEGLDWSAGRVPYEELKKELRDNRVYFYTGTHPASYTLNFIEAFMTGIPIVALGPEHGNANYFAGHNLYEIPNLITHGIDGFVSDSKAELQSYITKLFLSPVLAKRIGAAGRVSAIKYFGREKIKEQWRTFLNG